MPTYTKAAIRFIERDCYHPRSTDTEKHKHANLAYWCNDCDCKKVVMGNSDTGFFFKQFGHAFSDDDYHMVIYALCPHCIVERFMD